MTSRIGTHKLPSDFELNVKKLEYINIIICNDEKNIMLKKFSRLKNHYLTVDIQHEKLEYSGYMKVVSISDDYDRPKFIVHLTFEP